jgi:hypothetical protein
LSRLLKLTAFEDQGLQGVCVEFDNFTDQHRMITQAEKGTKLETGRINWRNNRQKSVS